MANKNLFSEGFRLNHDGRDLVIEKNLSSGLTGEVYRGRLTLPDRPDPVAVAVKVMKALDFPLARQMFYKEGETLAFLMHLEEETRDFLDENLKIAPIYYGLNEYRPKDSEDTVPYIVMELIDGTEVPTLLKSDLFSEFQSLVAAWHLYRIFDILHNRLQKTFIDLKFENLWWVANDSKWEGQLKLTDFGTLEEIKGEQRRGVSRDLLLGGVYLLAMLTGRVLAYSIGELKESAKPILNAHTDKMTWGTRRILSRLLHRNSDARPQTAMEVLTEIRQLVNFWSQTGERLHEMAQNNLSKAEAETDKAKSLEKPLDKSGSDAAVRAYSALDILRVKAPELFSEHDVERVKTVLSIDDYFERGYALLQGRSFQLARQAFEEGILWADNPMLLRHWAYAARIGEEVPPSDFEQRFLELKSLLEFINVDTPNPSKWLSAKRDLGNLSEKVQDKPSLKSKGLDYLIAECEFFDLYEQAQSLYADEKYKAAAKKFGEARAILEDKKRLPSDSAKLIEEETGNLLIERRNAEQLEARENSGNLYERAKKALESKGLELAENSCQDALIAYQPVSPIEFHGKHLVSLARLALELTSSHLGFVQEYVQIAYRIAGLGLFVQGKDVEFDKILKAANQLNLAIKKVSYFDTTSFCDLLADAHSLLGENETVTEAVAIHAANRAITAGEPLFLNGVADTVGKLTPSSIYPSQWTSKAKEILDGQLAQRHADVDDALSRVHQALLPILPDSDQPQELSAIFQKVAEMATRPYAFDLVASYDLVSRLETARVMLEKARKILGNEDEHRRDEIRDLMTSVETALENASRSVTAQSDARRMERARRLEALSQEHLDLLKEMDWAERGNKLGIAESVRNSIQEPLRQKLLDFLYRCYQIEAGVPESLSLEEAIQRSQKDGAMAAVEVSTRSLINWATHSLDQLGARAWTLVENVATDHREQIESESGRARAFFEKGDLASLAAELDRARPTLGETPEWRSLQTGLAQATAWNSWCEAKREVFGSGQADPGLLRDLRAFSNLNLPAVYWEQSPAPDYLDQMEKDLRQRVEQTRNIDAPEFVELLRSLLDIGWTKQLSANAERKPWNMKEWLKIVYSLASKRKMNDLTAQIIQTNPPENLDEMLRSVTFKDWLQVKEYETDEQNRIKQGEKRRKIFQVAAIVVTVCILLGGGGFAVYWANRPYFTQLTIGTYTPTPTIELPTPVELPVVPPTPVPPTPIPPPTIPPTPVPPSAYILLPDAVATLYPPAMVSGDAYWLIDDKSPALVLDPPLETPEKNWLTDISYDGKANAEPYIYTNIGSIDITWSMDTPFDTAGYYELFIVDTEQHSQGTQQFQILVDDQPVQPHRGTSQVIFQGYAFRPKDAWISLGVYQINAGQTLSVAVTLGQLTKDTPFAIDRLLIVRLNESTRQMLDMLPSGRTLVSMLDDPWAKFYEISKDEKSGNLIPNSTSTRGEEFSDVQAWNGSMTSRKLEQPYAPIWVDWTLGDRLSPGTYEVYVWIPIQHATVVANYFLLADGKVVERPSPAQINQADHPGAWVSLGTWTLDKEAIVGLRMIVDAGVVGEIGVDAVAIVKVEQ